MKSNLIVLLFILSSLGASAQETKTFSKTFTASGYANDVSYDYQATVKFKLFNSGFGELALKIGIMKYELLGFTSEGRSYSGNQKFDFPRELKNHQGDVSGNLTVKLYRSGHYVNFQDFRIPWVSQGSMDNFTFSKEWSKNVVDQFHLKTEKEIWDELVLELGDIEIENEHFSELSSMINQIKNEENAAAAKSSSSSSSSSGSSRNSKKKRKKKRKRKKKQKATVPQPNYIIENLLTKKL